MSAGRVNQGILPFGQRLASGLWLFALGFEIALCATLLRYDLRHLPLPCFDAVCGLVSHDPLSRPMGIYLPWFGLMGALLALATRLVGRRKLSAALVAAGGFVSIGLVVRQLAAYHGVCGWCGFSATAWCAAYALDLVADTPPLPRTVRSATEAGIATLFAVALQSLLVRQLTANALDLSQTSGPLLVQTSLPLSTNDAYGQTTVYFVEMECGACRREMTRLVANPPPTNVRLLCAKAFTEYDRQAALLLADCRNEAERKVALKELLSDDSLVEALVVRVRKQLHLAAEPSSQATSLLANQLLLAQEIHVRGVPTTVSIDEHGDLSNPVRG